MSHPRREFSRPVLVISRCLELEPCRYDGGIIRFDLVGASGRMARLVAFHAMYKFLLLAYNERELRELGWIVANPAGAPFRTVFAEYREGFARALAETPRYTLVIKVFQHIYSCLRLRLPRCWSRGLSGSERSTCSTRLCSRPSPRRWPAWRTPGRGARPGDSGGRGSAAPRPRLEEPVSLSEDGGAAQAPGQDRGPPHLEEQGFRAIRPDRNRGRTDVADGYAQRD